MNLAAAEVKSSKYLGGASIVLDPKESGSDAARAIQTLHQFIADRSDPGHHLLHPVAGRRLAEADRP